MLSVEVGVYVWNRVLVQVNNRVYDIDSVFSQRRKKEEFKLKFAFPTEQEDSFGDQQVEFAHMGEFAFP